MSLNYCEYLKIQEIEQMPKRFQKEYFRFLQGLGMVSAEQIAKTTDAPVDAILRLIRELNMRLESQSDPFIGTLCHIMQACRICFWRLSSQDFFQRCLQWTEGRQLSRQA